jgi:hypothetical protein
MSLFRPCLLLLATTLFVASCSKKDFQSVAIKPTDAELLAGKAPVKPPPSTETLNTLVANAPAGSTLLLTKGKIYEVSTTVVINKALIIDGTGSTINYTGPAGTTAISIESSNVTLKKLTIKANSGSNYIVNSKLISTNNNSNENFFSKINIENCNLSNINHAGIYMRYVRSFSLKNNVIYNIPYGGIILFSCVDGTITGNKVYDITANGTTGGNCYGISVSRQNGFPLDTVPRNILVSRNEVSRVPWEGIDTHGADYYTVDNNRVIDCGVGIAIVSAGSTTIGPSANKAPRFFRVTNNYITSNLSPDSSKSAIRIDGQDTLIEPASGLIELNTCFGQGIKLSFTKDVIIRSNIVERSSSAYGILLNGYNLNTTILNNQLKDIWLPNSNVSAAIGVRGEYNYSYIDGNVLIDNGFIPPAPAIKNSYGYKGTSTTTMNFPTFGSLNDFSIAGIAQIRL